MSGEQRGRIGVGLWLIVSLVQAGCFYDFDVAGKDQCRVHEDCLGGGVCVVEAGQDLGTCRLVQGDDGSDVGTDGDDVGSECPIGSCEPGAPLCVDASRLADCVLDERGCGVPATPVSCPDGWVCSAARCIQPDRCEDADRDGYGRNCRPGDDCDDGDPTRHPQATELCDDIDQDCDGDARDGFDLASDVSHCGACERACEGGQAVWRCDVGECVIDRCESGWANANGEVEDGCEVPCQPIATTEVACLDGQDDDCDGRTDGDDVDCIVTRNPAGPYASIELLRTDFASTSPAETSLQTQELDVDITGTEVVMAPRWVGSPLLPNGGHEATGAPLHRELVDQGGGRYEFRPIDAAGDPTVFRAFASRDPAASVFVAIAKGNEPVPYAWGSRLWLMARRGVPSASLFNGDYTGAFTWARTERADIRPLTTEVTWLGAYRFEGNAPGHQVTYERSASGLPFDFNFYPLAMELGQATDGAFWARRLRGGSRWDLGFSGELVLGGHLALLTTRSPNDCTLLDVERTECPPDAGWSAMVRSSTRTANVVQGRWVIVGSWLFRENVGWVKGWPSFLAVEVAIDAAGQVRAAGDYESLGLLGRASQSGPQVELDLDGLSSREGREPRLLLLRGVLAADGLSALLAMDSSEAPGPGLFLMIRL